MIVGIIFILIAVSFSGCNEQNMEDTKQDDEENPNFQNLPPTAQASANKYSGNTPLSIQFTGLGSDIDGTIVSYFWNFGDGGISNLQNPSHTYKNEGIYQVTFVVKDDDGATDTKTFTINAQSYPQQSYFTLTGKIHNSYDITIDVDYMVVSSGDWYDLGGTLYNIKQNGEKSFSSDVKGGYDEYTLIIGWFYPNTDTQVDRYDHTFTNPSGENMTFDINISSNGKIIVSET